MARRIVIADEESDMTVTVTNDVTTVAFGSRPLSLKTLGFDFETESYSPMTLNREDLIALRDVLNAAIQATK